MTCEGLGLPFHKTPYKFGNLFINFTVKFPEQVSESQIKQVHSILQSQAKSEKEINDINSVGTKFILKKFEDHHKNTHVQGGTRGNDSEEEEEEGEQGQRVGCQAQ